MIIHTFTSNIEKDGVQAIASGHNSLNKTGGEPNNNLGLDLI